MATVATVCTCAQNLPRNWRAGCLIRTTGRIRIALSSIEHDGLAATGPRSPWHAEFKLTYKFR